MNLNNKTRLATVLGTILFSQSAFSATTADIVFVVDESGSMAGEHSWLAGMVSTLDSQLNAAGVTNNRFGLVGFGGGSDHLEGHTHSVGGNQFGSSSQVSTAINTLLVSGGTEDGYSGMSAALNYSFRGDAAANIILVTDEDRDNINNSLTFESMQTVFSSNNALLNAVVDNGFTDNNSNQPLGVDSVGNAYLADGSGGFISSPGGAANNSTTKQDYIDLAFALNGAAWDLNLLRAGGLTADSFTSAFIDIKVAEITQQIPTAPTAPIIPTDPIIPTAPTTPVSAVPIPAALPLFGFGLAGLSWFSRKRKTV